MYYYGFDPTFILLIPAMFFAFYAQARVQGAFRRYSDYPGGRGITGAEAARKVLDKHGLFEVPVVRVSGNLTDHYDPRDRSVHLSDSVYGSTSVAAVSVACHECGHAIQHEEAYTPLVVRDAIVPAVNFASSISWVLIMVGIGIIFASGSSSGNHLGALIMDIGIIAFAVVTFFHLITLPVEFNASRRGIREMEELELVNPQNIKGAKKVLKAAAMTYVAALATALANLLRLLLIANRSRRD